MTIQSISVCTKATPLATVRLGPRGTWKLNIAAPAKADTLLNRARVTVGRGATFTLPTAANR